MSDEVQQLKTQMLAQSSTIDAQSVKLDGIQTGLTAVRGDITFLKEQIVNLENGATPAEIAELKTIADGIDTKLAAIGAKEDAAKADVEELDSETTAS